MVLTTGRLVLRELVDRDWAPVLAYQQKPEYLRYYEWTSRTAQDVRRFVRMFVDQQREAPRLRFQLAVTLRDTGALIGNCGIRRKALGAPEADIGYEIDPAWWGRGYATEAAGAVMRFGFDQLGLHRISSWCIADNAASARVLEKLGMRLEGRLRETQHFKGRWWDLLLYGILESEWRSGAARPDAASTETN
jgi:[ribosomal protein S5]-alanine N-acetyltransferase